MVNNLNNLKNTIGGNRAFFVYLWVKSAQQFPEILFFHVRQY
jgi:hypothetical protein